MTPVPIGYYPKHTERLEGPVGEIASASGCRSKYACPTWFSEHGNFWGFDTPEEARAAVPPDEPPGWEVYALRMFPVRFSTGVEEPFPLDADALAPLGDDFERLGFDAVQVGDYSDLGCSPLSCNGQTIGVALNRYYLVETEAEAIALAREFSITQPEPGPYCAVEVWRERRAA